MRRDHLLLRRAAKEGDAAATLELAGYYVRGDGVPRNYEMGMAYLHDLLQVENERAQGIVSELVPLDVIVKHGCIHLLAEAASRGNVAAARKLGIWLALRRESRTRGAELLDCSPDALEHPSFLLTFVRVNELLLDPRGLILAVGRAALERGDLADAAFCSSVVLHLDPECPTVSNLVINLLRLAAATDGVVPYLCTSAIFRALTFQADAGHPDALLALGCGWAGLPYGLLGDAALVPKTNHRRAVACLLRAADRGNTRAWMKLHSLASNYTSSAANQDLAKYCLERAVDVKDCQAQRMLAMMTLKSCTTLGEAEAAVKMLVDAATAGDALANELLQSFLVPLGEASPDELYRLCKRAEDVDPEVAARLRLVRAFGLTLDEAFSPLREAFRPWGLVLGGFRNSRGRVIPVASEWMRAELHRGDEFFSGISGSQDVLVNRKKRLLRELLIEFGLSPTEVFANADAQTLQKYAFGPAWAREIKRLIGHRKEYE